MIEVNLLPLQNVLSQQEKVFRQKLTYYALGLILLVVIFQVGLFLANTFVGLRNSAEQKKLDDQIALLKANDYEAATNLRTLSDKISGIKQIKKLQTDFGKVTGEVLTLTGSNAVLKSMSLDTTGQISITAVSPTLSTFGSFMDGLTSTRRPIPFTQVAISGIKETGDSIYFSLALKYNFNQTP